jgi:hypothetical protein
VVAAALAVGCNGDLDGLDGAFYNWDGRTLHCAVEIDSRAGNSLASIEGALDRANDRGEVLELLIHNPGESISWEDFAALLAAVDKRGLAWVTYEDMARGIAPVAGVALQYDDTYLDAWLQSLEYLKPYDARVTIFVTRYWRLSEEKRAKVRALHDAGHDIEAHAVNHLRAPVVVEEHGMQYYLDEEMQPSIDMLRADGYDIVAHAYPFGDRTAEIDVAVSKRIQLIRSVTISRSFVTSPCPY